MDVSQLRSMALQYFQCLSSGENYSQCIKQALFLDDKFNPLLIFDMISQGKQVQTRKDWRNYLHQINVDFSEEQLNYMLNHHSLGEETRFHEFIEAIMPFNSDVLRVFKKNYIDLIEIQKRDPEVEQIFGELIKFEIEFCRKLIKIKKQISHIAKDEDIVNLVKQDLVHESHKRGFIRQSVKYKEKFQSPEYQLGYDELRRFLELWLNQKTTNFQFQLMQIKRYLGTARPFKYITFKSEARVSPIKRKSYSAAKLSNKKHIGSTNKKQKEPRQNCFSSNRYEDFKADLIQGLLKTNQPSGYRQDNQFDKVYIKEEPKKYAQRPEGPIPSGVRPGSKNQQRQSRVPREKSTTNESREEYLRNIRYARDRTCINGTYIISRKQEQVEKLRKKLANCFQFNLINLFKLVDYNNKGFVTAKNFQQYLNSNSQQQFTLLFQYYGREKDKLRFQDFCMIFRPLSKKLNEILDQKPENILPNPFKRQTLSIIASIMTLSAEMFNNVFRMREQINSEGLKVSNLFNYVDVKGKGFIEAEDFQDLLDEKRIECNQRILKGLMKIFRKRLNDKISYQEFQAFIDI